MGCTSHFNFKLLNMASLVGSFGYYIFERRNTLQYTQKLKMFLFITTQFHQWNTEHVVPQSYLLSSCDIYPILSKI